MIQVSLILWIAFYYQLTLIDVACTAGVRAVPTEFRKGGVPNWVCRLDSFITDLKLPRKDFAD